MKMAITTPNSDTAVSPRFTTTSRSMSIEISPTRIAAPESSSAKAIRLYRTRSRTASRKVLKAIVTDPRVHIPRIQSPEFIPRSS